MRRASSLEYETTLMKKKYQTGIRALENIDGGTAKYLKGTKYYDNKTQ